MLIKEMTEEHRRCHSILWKKLWRKRKGDESYPVTSNLSRETFAGTETSKCATKIPTLFSETNREMKSKAKRLVSYLQH